MFGALQDKAKSVRSAALLGSMQAQFSDDKKLELIRDVIFDQTIEERQTAISALAELPASLTQPTYQELLDAWKDGSLVPEVRLDVSESITSVNDTHLIKALSEVQALSDGDIVDAYRDCLSGGDADNGSQILWQHTGAQCIRCHVMFDYGGIAGPELTHIADELSPEQLLESLIKPSARIAPGYGVVSLILKDDSEIDGVLVEEAADVLKIQTTDGDLLDVDTDTIAERIDALSAMPDMSKIMTKKEIRDLLAYLVKLKKGDS